jgi:hypothetical protein
MKIVFSCLPKDFNWREEDLADLALVMGKYLNGDLESENKNLVLGGYGQEVHVKIVGVSTTLPPSMLRNVAIRIFWFLKIYGLVEHADVCFMGFGREGFFMESDFPELKKSLSPLQK